MNKIYILLVIFLISILASTTGYCQQFFFASYSINKMHNPETVSVLDTSGYSVSFKTKTGLIKLTLNISGEITDTCEINLKNDIVDYRLTSSNEFIVLSSHSTEQTPQYYLTRLDSCFEQIWTVQIEGVPVDTEPEFSLDENQIMVYSYSTHSQLLWVSHFTSEGQNVSRIAYDFDFGQYEDPDINLIYKYGFYYLSINENFIKFDSNGDEVWSKYSEYYKDIRIFNNRNILLVSHQSLYLYSPTGTLISSESLSNYESILSTYVTQQEDVVIGTEKSIIKYDSQLTYEWREEIYFEVASLCETNDEWIIAVGNKSNRITGNTSHLIKIAPEGINKPQVAILSPASGQILDYLEQRIEVYTKFVLSIRIKFSSNAGESWDTVYVGGTQHSNLQTIYRNLPEANSANCILSIEDVSDPGLQSTTNGQFAVYTLGLAETIEANNIFMWIGANGMSSHNPVNDDSGLYWAEGERLKKPTTFLAGILWGGKVNGEIRAGGSAYRYGLRPGPILDYNNYEINYNNSACIYKLTKDWQQLPEGELKEKYQYNFDNWPGELGAPYVDVNWDKQYSPGIDKPQILGDETLFYVANDMDEERTRFLYGSPPLGLEFRQTLFAFDTPELADVVFKKINLINKSPDRISEMYISYFCDDDLGYAGDDFSGCDTSLNLAYTYNADNNDDDYFANAPPAVGRVLLQGPQINSPSDSALTSAGILKDTKNLPVTSYVMYINANRTYGLPTLGDYSGTIQLYNQMHGKLWDGSAVVDPNTGDSTVYMVPGDPVNSRGWYEGNGWPAGTSPGNRFDLLTSGPFDMGPGEEQEVVYAIVIARGADNLNSITKLKEKAFDMQLFWRNYTNAAYEEKKNHVVKEFYLSQNYPNPFNPTTTIEYSLPMGTDHDLSHQPVKLIVYNILGREVETLVNEQQIPGKYWVEFDGSNFASGIYFYRLSAGNFSKTQKMILLK